MQDPPAAITSDSPHILVVDDEKFIRDILADFLTLEGYSVRTAADGAAAIEEMRHSPYDLVITDLKMPKLGGLDLLKEISTRYPETLTIIMTGFGTVETAIDAMKQGAYDYILKPFKTEVMMHTVQRGIEKRRLAAENLRLREALSLYKVTEAIAASLSLDDVISTASDSVTAEVQADVVMTWLDDAQGGFYQRALSVAPQLEYDASCVHIDPTSVSERLRSGRPLVEHGTRSLNYFLPGAEPPVQSLLAVPLKARERLLGWIAAVSLTQSKHFDEGQRKLLSIIASRAAASIENARLYEDLQSTFQQTIQSLANAIDKMDRYTAGHSERVATYAVALAQRLKLSADDIAIVRHSALMHDIGKIGCVLNLNKPGRLTPQEYEAFKRHPVYGREILDPIRFLKPVIPGVYSHHEYWNGRGYPQGLAGESIPLVARVIAIADTYDAMTSDRAYRPALPHEATIDEIERCAGSQFDPDSAHVFVSQLDDIREQLRAAGFKVPE
jgi:response regulator RpfG family c-di-GMP phosphodiesterase